MAITDPSSRALAWLELNVLNITGAVALEGARLDREPTEVYDVNGDLLFHRYPLAGPQESGFADAAADPRVGATLLAVTASGAEWNEDALLEEAVKAFRKRHKTKFTTARFVAYSYPKLAVQFRREDEEVALLELFTWEQVPPARKPTKDEPLSNFDRWSFLDELGPRKARTRQARFEKRVDELKPLLERLDGRKYIEIAIAQLEPLGDLGRFIADTRVLHYSKNNADHQPCCELRGQLTHVWCVAASVQMLLDFYRYEYAQTRLATELHLGTLANPNGLYYGDEQDVVTTIEQLTSNALDATLNFSPTWAEFRNEIRVNRPLISFTPTHSRMVAGYTRSGIFSLSPFRGLLVYDPWPPTTGVITKWENFDVQQYRCTFTARVTLV